MKLWIIGGLTLVAAGAAYATGYSGVTHSPVNPAEHVVAQSTSDRASNQSGSAGDVLGTQTPAPPTAQPDLPEATIAPSTRPQPSVKPVITPEPTDAPTPTSAPLPTIRPHLTPYPWPKCPPCGGPVLMQSSTNQQFIACPMRCLDTID